MLDVMWAYRNQHEELDKNQLDSAQNGRDRAPVWSGDPAAGLRSGLIRAMMASPSVDLSSYRGPGHLPRMLRATPEDAPTSPANSSRRPMTPPHATPIAVLGIPGCGRADRSASTQP
jgi:hypothetical protein